MASSGHTLSPALQAGSSQLAAFRRPLRSYEIDNYTYLRTTLYSMTRAILPCLPDLVVYIGAALACHSVLFFLTYSAFAWWWLYYRSTN